MPKESLGPHILNGLRRPNVSPLHSVYLLTLVSFGILGILICIGVFDNEQHSALAVDQKLRDPSLLQPSIMKHMTVEGSQAVFSGVVQTIYSEEENRAINSKKAETGQSIDVRTSSMLDQSHQNEPSVAVKFDVHPNGNLAENESLVVGANDYRNGDSQCGVYGSHDGGNAWTDLGTLPGPFISRDKIPLSVQGDPVVRYSRNGTLFYACLAFNREPIPSGGSIFVSRSDDDGKTWNPSPVPVRTAPIDGSEFNDKPWLATDNSNASRFRDNIYLCWTQFSRSVSTIQFAKSADHGLSYSEQLPIGSSTFSHGCSIAVLSDGTIYLAWGDYSTLPGKLLIRKSTDGGENFESAVHVNDIYRILSPLPNNNFRTNSFPSMAVSQNGDVHIVWADDRFRSTGFGSDILIATSTDGGSRWKTEVVNDIDLSSADQFFPTVTIPKASSGTIHVFYYDKKYSSGIDGQFNILLDLTQARSDKEKGRIIFALSRVSDQSSDVNNCGFANFIGDYIDAWPGKSSIHLVWTDCRGADLHGEDIFSDKIRFRAYGTQDR